MASAEARFWTERERYHELAQTIEQGIDRHGARGRYECDLNGFSGHCPFCATNPTYYEYRGPNI